jgi:hypothetical protein
VPVVFTGAGGTLNIIGATSPVAVSGSGGTVNLSAAPWPAS